MSFSFTMKNTINLALILLCTMCMVSCTNWQEKYDTDLALSTQCINEKVEFIKEKAAQANNEGKVYEPEDDIPLETIMEIALLAPDTIPESTLCPENVFLSLDLSQDNSENILNTYEESFAQTIKSKEDYEYFIYLFDHDVVERLQNIKYFVVVEPLCRLNPSLNKQESFDIGYIMDNVTIYDIDTGEKVKEIKVVSRNSETLTKWIKEQDKSDFSMDDLMRNLEWNRRDIVINEVISALP